jgi:hypothetical protein
MLRRLLRLLNAEIVIGFLIATVVWIGVLGWQAAYAPTEIEKQKCQETTEKESRKAEECKSIWEKTTTDPVAFFNLWLVIFTGGLTISTVMLWLAGEKQIEFLRESSEAQSRDMQASIVAVQTSANAALASVSSERAWMMPDQFPVHEAFNGKTQEGSFKKAVFSYVVWRNRGRSPALHLKIFTTHKLIPFEDTDVPRFEFPADGRGANPPVGPGAAITSDTHPAVDADRGAIFNRTSAFVLYSALKYRDIFWDVERFSEVCVVIRYDGTQTDPSTGQTGPRWAIRLIGPQNTVT